MITPTLRLDKTDSIREAQSASQCASSESDPDADEMDCSAVSRHSDGVRAALLAAASSDGQHTFVRRASAFTIHCSGLALKPQS